ncbi:hypothetical protein ABKN59_008839 [Abortiporus biennis]
MDPEILSALRDAVQDCSERALTVASKWASELLLSVSPKNRQQTTIQPLAFQTSTPARSRSPRPSLLFVNDTPGLSPEFTDPLRHPHAPGPQIQPHEERVRELQLEAQDADYIATAKPLMDAREYTRAAHWLRDCQSSKAKFLRVYSLYLASEKKSLREWYKQDCSRQQPPLPVNQSLIELLAQVSNATDPWQLFLKALFLFRLSRRAEAIECALLSIASYPWNWSVWTLLGECLGDGEELASLLPLIPLPTSHPLVQLFQVKTMNSLNSPTEHELGLCDRLLRDDLFPRSLWIMSLRACVLYHMHDFGPAEEQFKKIREIDPYRIDDIDVYSNILYVNSKRLELSKLAHEFLELDRDRPEICCLVGNHYSLKGEHEKAVKYFRRATQLDRTYLSAWTLMGHEYVEMKNSHAAIEAYRKAVDVNRKDFRAWYGLGQAYELLSMHQYALYYYQHATALRPYDVRIWQAQGMCYEQMGRLREAIECMKRALLGADSNETIIHLRLAKLYNDLEDYKEAATYHQRVIDVCVAAQKPVTEWAKSVVYVARYHFQHGGGDLQHAKRLLELVAASQSEEVSQGTELLKRVNRAITSFEQLEAAKRAME